MLRKKHSEILTVLCGRTLSTRKVKGGNMINLLEELLKLMTDNPLPYGRKPILMHYENNGGYQRILILCSPKSIIWKNLYRDESESGCYVLEDGEWMSYQLGDILFRRKRPRCNESDERDLQRERNS